MPTRSSGSLSHVRHQKHCVSAGSPPPLDAGRLSVCLQAVKRDVLQDMDVKAPPPRGFVGAVVGASVVGFISQILVV